MAGNPHYKGLLQPLNEFQVEYLIVGGLAVMKYGEPRYTKDLDVWVHNSAQNSRRVVDALKKFSAPSRIMGSRRRHSPKSRSSIKSELRPCGSTF